MYTILGIGELLWDMLPEGPQLGGAPANYSVMAGRMGNHATVLSRIGRDGLGERALEMLRPFPVDCTRLQVDPEQATGRVTVKLEDGQPSYTIHQPVAWDFFELTKSWLNEAAQADAVCFGSLAQRSEQSRQTIHALVKATRPQCQRIFDVNLRAPFYSAEIVRESLELASVMKMNDAEVQLVLDLLGFPTAASLRGGAERLLEHFTGLALVAITRGGTGSLLVGRSEWNEHPGIPIKVADTIGAGDAFTAAMTHYLLRGASLSVLNEAGNRWGSYVASQSGAMPEIGPETLQRITREIEG
ncbi:carbohydrate kinase family protein [Acidicapsa acidisoli]|uniref:carbohydrate kinase family protein n=1 Tax=Acidicapsa acidisoli TaxID=1615681 RepID=UPI0021DFC477|nr:carbohydrate kinase [Acidicapsa acidisoli]